MGGRYSGRPFRARHYNGEKPWNAALDLFHLVEPMPDGYDHFRPAQRYVVIDQRRLSPELLANSRSLVATLFRMELSDWPDVLREAIPSIAAWLSQDEFEPVRRTVNLWLQQRFAREFRGETVLEAAHLNEENAMAIYPRKYDTWTDAVMDRGRQEGLDRGRQEGLAQGTKSILKRLAEKRFGTDCAQLLGLIDAAAEGELDRLVDLLVSARSADEVVSGMARNAR